MYDFPLYGDLIADQARTGPYVEALRRVVTADSVVLDLGAGATAYFAMLACRFGARRVFAIEADEAIAVARQVARANGMDDRIEFFHGASTAVTLPERADVIISDLHDLLPLDGDAVVSLIDARRRLLSPTGRFIPARETLWVAGVDAEDLYDAHVKAWTAAVADLDLGPARDIMLHRMSRGPARPDQVRLAPQRWGELVYATVEAPGVSGRCTWTVEGPATLHGWSVWFDAELVDEVGFSNRPGEPETVFANGFLPCLEPVGLEPGQQVELDLRAAHVGGEYVLRWGTTVRDREGAVLARFRQSTFQGVPVVPETLARRLPTHVPVLGPDAAIDRFVIEAMQAGAPLAEIAKRLTHRFPDRFPDPATALGRVGDLSVKYGV